MSTYYDGYAHNPAMGGRITHETCALGISLTVEVPGDDDVAALLLSPDEAFKLAVSLLRDVSLARFGVG